MYVCLEHGDADGGPDFRLVRFSEERDMCACVDRWGDIDFECAEKFYEDDDNYYYGDYQ